MKKYIFIFLLLSIILSLFLFSGKSLLATGEEGIPFFNIHRTFSIYNSVWYETGTGYSIPVLLPRVTFFIFSWLFSSFSQTWIVQRIILTLLIFCGMFSMFLFARFFTKNNTKVALIAGMFYLFNLYTISQIWQRFLYTDIVAWAYLPLFLFLCFTFLQKGKFNFFFLFLLSSLLFSDTFGQPAFVFTFGIPFIIYIILSLIDARKKRGEIKSFIGRLFLLGVGFIAINIWWIYPYLTLGSSSFSTVSSWKDNLASLQGVSQYFPSSTIFLLRQNFLFGVGSVWYGFYSKAWIILFSVIILIAVVIGIFSSKREKYWKYIFLLLFIGWFVSKGSNVPLGNTFFAFLFKTFPSTALLRNPYEKFGLVFLLAYSLFFAYGVLWIIDFVKPKIYKISIGACFSFIILAMTFPLYNGSFYERIIITPPSDYNKINIILDKQKSDGRILVLPIIPGDSVHYNWGYWGLEPSEFLFDKPSISKTVRTQYFDNKFMELYNSFISNSKYNTLLDELDIKYLIVHNDQDEKASGASTSAQVIAQLAKNSNIKLLSQTKALSLYEFKGNTEGLIIAKGNIVPKILYKKLSTTHYLVKITDAKNPYQLIFKETFHPKWIARIGSQIITSHKLAYDFANEWYVAKKGTYTIDIRFKIYPWE